MPREQTNAEVFPFSFCTSTSAKQERVLAAQRRAVSHEEGKQGLLLVILTLLASVWS